MTLRYILRKAKRLYTDWRLRRRCSYYYDEHRYILKEKRKKAQGR